MSIRITKRALKQFQKLDKKRKKAVDTKIQDIQLDYEAYSKMLHANLAGLRSAHAGNDRIVFAVCEECRREGWEHHNMMRCGGCEDKDDDTILILAIGHRKNIYDIIE